MERLFVYGTLAPGRPNEHILSNIDGSWEEGSVKGTLHQEGWGADMGYPGISLEIEREEVNGFLFSSKELFKKWDELDKFEGIEYQRIVTKVKLENEKLVDAYIYALK
jgi:gamma-glutamylcyclotransferase (GGCT)/AIG2-like uncharacterized protein YtfP